MFEDVLLCFGHSYFVIISCGALLTGCFDFVAVYIPCQLCCKYDCMLNRRPICAFELLIP